MTKTISTFEEALSYLAEFSDGREEYAPNVIFEGEVSNIALDVSGTRYHSSIPGELARGLWEYQEAIYKAVSFALYGVEDIRKLTTAQRQDFELVFTVSEGSTGLMAPLKDFLTKLGEGFLTMDSKHKAYTMVAIGVILTLGYAATNIVESSSTVKKDDIKATLAIRQEEEKTKQFEVIARLASVNQVAAGFAKASEDGARSIVRSAPDATHIKLGRAQLNRSDIEEVNQRAVKEKASAQIIQEDFRVFGTQSRDASATRYLLARKDGTEFSVVVSHDEHTAVDLEKIWSAARDRKPIALEVNATIVRGAIRAAQVVKVL